jgi:tRNA(Ile)-lysidine synthase
MTAAVEAQEACAGFAPLAAYGRIALAVSGGPDSVALAYLVARWRAERGETPDVTLLTVDHDLRPGSREEALFVARIAKSLGLPHAILTWSHGGSATSGLQTKARAARYDLMAAYCHAHDIEALVTAHHLDDQAETFLMRLKRGSGLDGLAAIPEASVWGGVPVLRPLLEVPKARLAATLNDAGITFVEDPSNADLRFERARMRANGDALAKLGLSPEALARSARRLRRAQYAIETATTAFLAEHGAVNSAGFCVLGQEALAAAPAEIALRALSRAITALGGRAKPVRLSKLEALLDALQNRPQRTHTLGGCRIQPMRGGRIGVFRETRGTGLPSLRLRPGERALWDNRFRVELGASEARPVTVEALGEAGWRGLRPSLPWLAELPRFAGATLPAARRGREIIVPPHLVPYAVTARHENAGFAARFVGLAWPGHPADPGPAR